MPIWFNINNSDPTEDNGLVRQWSFFPPSPADWNRAPAGVVRYRLPETPPSELHPPHAVPEILFVFEGEGVLQEGDRKSEIKAGDTIYVPAGEPHLIWSTSDDPQLALVAFRIMPEMGVPLVDEQQL